MLDVSLRTMNLAMTLACLCVVEATCANERGSSLRPWEAASPSATENIKRGDEIYVGTRPDGRISVIVRVDQEGRISIPQIERAIRVGGMSEVSSSILVMGKLIEAGFYAASTRNRVAIVRCGRFRETKANKRMQPTLNPSVTCPAEQDARQMAGG